MKKLKYLSIFLLILFIISSCTPVDEPTKEATEGYPVDGGAKATLDPEILATDIGYPVDESTTENHGLPEDLEIPAPSEGTAVIHGVLISLSDENSPYIAPALYLGTLLSANNGEGPYLGSISVDEDPLGQQATNGEFLFTDVPPGNYGLFIWTPVNAFIIKDEKTGEPVVLEVTAGETIDLGTIFVP